MFLLKSEGSSSHHSPHRFFTPVPPLLILSQDGNTDSKIFGSFSVPMFCLVPALCPRCQRQLQPLPPNEGAGQAGSRGRAAPLSQRVPSLLARLQQEGDKPPCRSGNVYCLNPQMVPLGSVIFTDFSFSWQNQPHSLCSAHSSLFPASNQCPSI